MIQATELRIGNILDKGKVESIDIDGAFIGLTIDDKYGTRFGKEYTTWINLKPIPLTEQQLIKLGAEELIRMSDDYVRYNLDGIQLSLSPERDFFMEYVHQIPIKYLHTLQNFYYFTKQKELEVK